MTRPLSFRVIEGGRGAPPLHRVPMVPRDDLAPAYGFALAMVGGVLIWAALAVVAWNVWGRP